MINLLSPSRLAWSLMAIATCVHAVPLDLFRRFAVNYVDCSNTRETKLRSAFGDAAQLALHAYNIDRSSTAFTHYLRDEDGDYANSLWSMAAANNDPTNAPYTFSVRCAKTCTGGESSRQPRHHRCRTSKRGWIVPEQDDFKSHGTNDVNGYDADYVTTAREFLSDWVNQPEVFPENALKPYQNAENIAAAATENWFIKQCGFTEISL